MAKVLVFLDPQKDRANVRKAVGRGVDLTTASNWNEFKAFLNKDSFDLVILDKLRGGQDEDLRDKVGNVPLVFIEEGLFPGVQQEKTSSGLEVTPDQALELSRRFMDENFLKPLTLVEIATVAQISPSYFCRRFKEVYGMSPITYLKELRLNRACHLLEHTNLPLADITNQSGFFSIPYFCREFKKTHGISPIHYRRKKMPRSRKEAESASI